MSECQVQIWLAAKGRTPFTVDNIYARWMPSRFSKPTLFDDSFRGAFFRNYHKTGSSRFYDLWECNPKA